MSMKTMSIGSVVVFALLSTIVSPANSAVRELPPKALVITDLQSNAEKNALKREIADRGGAVSMIDREAQVAIARIPVNFSEEIGRLGFVKEIHYGEVDSSTYQDPRTVNALALWNAMLRGDRRGRDFRGAGKGNIERRHDALAREETLEKVRRRNREKHGNNVRGQKKETEEIIQVMEQFSLYISGDDEITIAGFMDSDNMGEHEEYLRGLRDYVAGNNIDTSEFTFLVDEIQGNSSKAIMVNSEDDTTASFMLQRKDQSWKIRRINK